MKSSTGISRPLRASLHQRSSSGEAGIVSSALAAGAALLPFGTTFVIADGVGEAMEEELATLVLGVVGEAEGAAARREAIEAETEVGVIVFAPVLAAASPGALPAATEEEEGAGVEAGLTAGLFAPTVVHAPPAAEAPAEGTTKRD